MSIYVFADNLNDWVSNKIIIKKRKTHFLLAINNALYSLLESCRAKRCPFC